jgi:outer membrane protein assembly factor BamB
MRITSLCAIALTLVLGSSALLVGQDSRDWPQFRGLNRNGVATAFSTPKAWPQQLTRKWKIDVGEGYATPILVRDRLYVFTRQGENEVMQGIDAASGKSFWQTRYAAPVKVKPAAQPHGPGPKSTPAYADGRVFTLGMGGTVTAFDAASGKQLWQRPPDAVLPEWGTALSPLVDRGLVIVHVGGHNKGALTAFDVATGAVKWSWSGDGPSYASPVVADLNGVHQIIALSQDNVVGVSAADGQLLWRRPFSTEYAQNIITPVVIGDTVIIGGYQKPTSAFRVVRKGNAWTTEDVWQNPDVQQFMTNPVLVGDTLFGLSSRNRGQYFLLDVKTGKTVWTGMPRQAENAAIVRAGNFVLSLEDDAELVVGQVTGSQFQEVKRYRVADGATWAAPVISADRVVVKDVSTLALWTWGDR